MAARTVVTLTTDFGLADHFVGVMKGVILAINPEAQLVDLTHEIHSFDVLDGALTLNVSYRFFPPGTVHLVVVDPGVGSARRPILATAGRHTFVAPDNGVLSLVLERHEGAEVRHATASQYFLQPVSNTFQGRDIFAPMAAWLSKGIPPDKFGDVIHDYVRIALPRAKRIDDKVIKATVLKVDKFGNLLTNITPQDLAEAVTEERTRFKLVINQREITRHTRSFTAGKPGELFSYVGSSGFLELAVNQASAAEVLQAGAGTEVTVLIEDTAG